MSLPPLTPELIELDSDYPGLDIDEMVRAYGEACAVAERERCAKLCDGISSVVDNCADGVGRVAGMNTANSCAAAIRSVPTT